MKKKSVLASVYRECNVRISDTVTLHPLHQLHIMQWMREGRWGGEIGSLWELGHQSLPIPLNIPIPHSGTPANHSPSVLLQGWQRGVRRRAEGRPGKNNTCSAVLSCHSQCLTAPGMPAILLCTVPFGCGTLLRRRSGNLSRFVVCFLPFSVSK